jgi:hypothetical protein
MHNNTSTLERLGGTNTLSLFYLREHGKQTRVQFRFYHDFQHDARRPMRPHKSIKPKLEVSAGGTAHTRVSL